MKKLSLCIILFGLLSTSQAEENYYVPIQNLVPLSYNPLTTNYNPDYDNYTGLSSKQSQGNDQTVQLANSARNSACEEVKRLDKQWRDRSEQMSKADIADMLKLAMQGSQDRLMMKYAQQNCTNANILASANLYQQNELKQQDLMSQRNPSKQYEELVNAMVDATSLKDSVRNSALASQDRFQINQISGSGGCGSRGGPGYRKANGQCASWSD